MNKLIRHSCFETNSSSCHSISIAPSNKTTIFESLTPNDDGVLEISPMEFGWDVETFSCAHDKLSYLLLYIRDWVEDEKRADFKHFLEKVVLIHTQAMHVKLQGEDSQEKFGRGYIDHQSVESQDFHYLFEDPDQLKDFIFNPASELKTDNDNRDRSDDE